MGERGPPDIGGLISLKVDNFPFNVTAEDLREIFSKYGDVKDCYLPKDHASGQSRGFGFIRFSSEDEVEDAIKGANGTVLAGRELRVQVAQHSRPPLPPRGSSSGYSAGNNQSQRGGYSERRNYDDRHDDRRGYERRDDRRRDDRTYERERERVRERERERDVDRDRRRRHDGSDSDDAPRRRRHEDIEHDDRDKYKSRNRREGSESNEFRRDRRREHRRHARHSSLSRH